MYPAKVFVVASCKELKMKNFSIISSKNLENFWKRFKKSISLSNKNAEN